jgi:hypothetical protein
LVEQRTENPRVGGSIPPLGTITSLKKIIDLNDKHPFSFGEIDMNDADSEWH